MFFLLLVQNIKTEPPAATTLCLEALQSGFHYCKTCRYIVNIERSWMTSDALTIYHNPACSKSRETLQILENNNAKPLVIEYLDNPPSKTEINQIIKMLGIAPVHLLRTTEAAYKDAGYNVDTMSNVEIIDAICEHPSLLQRPIVIYGGKAVIGRPPERVLDIIPAEIV